MNDTTGKRDRNRWIAFASLALTVTLAVVGLAADILGIRSAFTNDDDTTEAFVKPIANFDAAADLTTFLDAHENQIVLLNSHLDPEVLPILTEDGDYDRFAQNRRPTITLWTHCFTPLLSEEDPSSAKCDGAELIIRGTEEVGKPGIIYNNGAYYLRGHFAVGPIVGPQMGIMSYNLRPVLPEEAR